MLQNLAENVFCDKNKINLGERKYLRRKHELVAVLPGMEASSKLKTGLGMPLPMIVISFDLRQSSDTISGRLETAGCSM